MDASSIVALRTMQMSRDSRLVGGFDETKIRVKRGSDVFLVCVSQLSVTNLKRLFQVATKPTV